MKYIIIKFLGSSIISNYYVTSILEHFMYIQLMYVVHGYGVVDLPICQIMGLIHSSLHSSTVKGFWIPYSPIINCGSGRQPPLFYVWPIRYSLLGYPRSGTSMDALTRPPALLSASPNAMAMAHELEIGSMQDRCFAKSIVFFCSFARIL